MGLPIFALILALISHTFINSYENLTLSFYIESIIVLVFSIYFIFYLIYNGFETKITHSVTNAFTREYLYEYLNKEISTHKNYTLILISCDNIEDINTRYGIQNGDKVLHEVSRWISEYLKSKKITSYPFGHIKNGDFVIGLKGNKEQYTTIMELMCLKSEELKVNDIEVKISGAINDTTYSHNLDYLIENLFEIQKQNRNYKIQTTKFEQISPNELESFVIKALAKRSFVVKKQAIFENDKVVMNECFVKLLTPDGKEIHPKGYMKILDKLRLMVDFDLMVLRYTIEECLTKDDLTYALSISPTTIRNYKFFNEFKKLINTHKNIKGKIMLILHEREYYSRIERYKDTLESLRSEGVLLALDKFGLSHTSFLYFKELDVDALRFDRHYTKKLNQKDQIILSGFIKMAHDRGVKTWAKMVEDAATKEQLSLLGIDYMQGKYLAPLEKQNEG